MIADLDLASDIMSPCSASHCSAVRTQCHYIGCRHELRNRLDRRYKTRDDIKKKLKTEESDIHFLKRQIDRECDPLAWQTSLMLHARKAYDDQMSMKTRNRGNECTECAIASKDDEIALLKKKAEAAKSFAGFLREFPRVPRYV